MGCYGRGEGDPNTESMRCVATLTLNLSYREDNSSNIIIEAGSSDGFLMLHGSTGLFRKDKSCPDPYSSRTEHKCAGDALPIEQATCSDDLNVVSTWRFLASTHSGDGWDQYTSGDVTCMTTTFTALGAEHINAHIHASLDVLRVSYHVHIKKPVFMELVDNLLVRNTDSGDEKLSARFDNDVGKLIQSAFGVVMAVEREFNSPVRNP